VKPTGLDLSLTSTGVATVKGTSRICPKCKGMERLVLIRNEVLALRPEFVVLEGYSFGSRGRALFNIGELGGVIRMALWERDIPFLEVSPSALKKYATGKGNAPKDAVLATAIRNDFEGSNNDEADAWWLLQMGLATQATATNRCKLPKYRLEVLKALPEMIWRIPMDAALEG